MLKWKKFEKNVKFFNVRVTESQNSNIGRKIKWKKFEKTINCDYDVCVTESQNSKIGHIKNERNLKNRERAIRWMGFNTFCDSV